MLLRASRLLRAVRAASCCPCWLLRVLCCNHRSDMGRKKMTPFTKAKKLQNRMEASLPSALQEELGTTTVTDSSPPEIVETQHSSAAHSVNSIRTRQRNFSSRVFIHGNTYDMTYVTSQPAPSQPAPSGPAPSRPAPSQPAPSQQPTWSSQRTPQPQSQPAPSQPAPSQPAWSSQRTPQPQSQQTPAQQPQSPWAPTPGANANLKKTRDFEKMSSNDLEHALHCLQQISNYTREVHSLLSC